jgi:hypothetical protein
MSKRTLRSSINPTTNTSNKRSRSAPKPTNHDELTEGPFATIPNEILNLIVAKSAHKSILKNLSLVNSLSVVNTRFNAAVRGCEFFPSSYRISYKCCKQTEAAVEGSSDSPHFQMCEACIELYDYMCYEDVSTYPCFVPGFDSSPHQILFLNLYNGRGNPILEIRLIGNLVLSSKNGEDLSNTQNIKLLEARNGVFYKYICYEVKISPLIKTAGRNNIELTINEAKDQGLLSEVMEHHKKKNMKKCFSFYDGLKHVLHCNLHFFKNKL